MEIKDHEIKISMFKTDLLISTADQFVLHVPLLRKVLIPEFWGSPTTLPLSFALFISRASGLVDCTPLVPLPPSPLLSPMSPSQFKSHSFLCQDIKGYSPFNLFPILPICFLYCSQSELLKNQM